MTVADQGMARRLKKARIAAKHEHAKDFADIVGVKEGTYRTHEDGTKGFLRRLDEYADKLGVNRDWLRYGDPHAMHLNPAILVERNSFPFDNGKSRAEDTAIGRSELTRTGVTVPGTQDRLLSIFGSLPGAAGGWVMNAIPAVKVETPERLKDAQGAFGLYMMGDDMWPRVKDGEPLYLHPTQLPKIEDCVVIFLKSEESEWICRDLVDRRVDIVRVRKYGRDKAPEEYNIPWSDIHKMYAIA